MRHGRLAPGRGVVHAERLVALIDAVDAIGGADAGPDLVLAAFGDLAHEMRIGDVGAGHADHVELALGDGVARRRHVGDAGGMEHRELGRRPDLAGEVEMRRRRHALHRDDLLQRHVGLDVAADDVEEIDLAAGDQAAGDLDALLAAQPLVPVLVGDQPEADDERRADPPPDRVEDAEGEAQPVVERAAILVVAPVGRRRPELVEEVAIGLELDAVEPGRLHALGRVGIAGHDAVEVPFLGDLGKGAMGRLAHRRGRQHRQPVGLVPVGPPPQVGQLDHHRAALGMAVLGQPLHPGDDLVLVGVQVAEGRRRIRGDDRRAGGHRHGDPALGLLQVIEPVAVARHAVLGIGRLVGGAHDPVLEDEMLQPIGLEQGIMGDHRELPCMCGRRPSPAGRSSPPPRQISTDRAWACRNPLPSGGTG